MARIVVTSACYLGDLAPFVAPADRLVDRGHDVTFVAPRGFHPILAGERFGLADYGLDFSAPAMHRDPAHQRLLRHPFRNMAGLARYWMRVGFLDDPGAVDAAMTAALDGADAVVVHPTVAQVVGPIARSLGVPVVVGHLFPMMVDPPGGAAFAAVSGALMYDRQLNRHRVAHGLAPMRGNALQAWREADAVVTLLSGAYAGAVPAVGGPAVGFSHWPGPAGQPVPEAVTAFLDAGDPPVLVCLGTSAASSVATFRTIVDGLAGRGLRALVLAGNEANVAALGDRPGVVAFAPIAAVLPRCRSAVVSGALGSLAACLAAGVPTVVVPQLFDQVWHGRRVAALGVGRMVWRASSVAGAVVGLDDGTFARAGALAEAMRGEDGAGALADAVEATIR